MKLKTAMLMIALSLPLAGCGNKGPLVLPQAPVPVDQAVPATDAVPADATDPVPADPASTPPAPTPPVPAEPVPDEPVPDEPVPAPTQDGDG